MPAPQVELPPGGQIVTLRDRPDLLPVMAEWLWREFWQGWGYTLEQTHAVYATCIAEQGPPQSFVLLVDGAPVGTATLARHDLDERPALSPWLAGVFVVPPARGRRYVTPLIRTVEAASLAARLPTLWLYTSAAERVYAREGWHSVETVERAGKRPVVVMRRDLADAAARD